MNDYVENMWKMNDYMENNDLPTSETVIVLFSEIKSMSIYKKYDPGEPTLRLYLKNLAKQVEEKVRIGVVYAAAILYMNQDLCTYPPK